MIRYAVAAAAALIVLSGCGGGSDAEPESTPASASRPTPSPTPAAQPEGADGVTIDILNWKTYADDQAVLAWKQATELFYASGNSGKILPGMREAYSRSVFDRYLSNLRDYVWKNQWHNADEVAGKIARSRTTGATTELVACLWAPDATLFTQDGGFVDRPDDVWLKYRVTVTSAGGDPVISKVVAKGECPGGPPR